MNDMTTEQAIEYLRSGLPFQRRHAANLESAGIFDAAASLRRRIRRQERVIARLRGEAY